MFALSRSSSQHRRAARVLTGRLKMHMASATDAFRRESDTIKMIRHSASQFVAQEITPFVSLFALSFGSAGLRTDVDAYPLQCR